MKELTLIERIYNKNKIMKPSILLLTLLKGGGHVVK
jgi:hypothetical protein